MAPNSNAECPACRQTGVADCGSLPPLKPGIFAGRPAVIRMSAGHLMHCSYCDLRFRYPSPSQEELTALYSSLPTSVWQAPEPRPYWPRVLEVMENLTPKVNRTVLDVGCFDGEFLCWLPPGWQKLGIEPGTSASELAASRGVTVLGETLERTNRCDDIGCITLFDVIEHIVHPFEFLQRVRNALAPRGVIIIMTGAADSAPFRVFGRHYWYSSLPEHVSFLSRRWLEWAAAQLDLRIASYELLSSEPTSWTRWARSLLQLSLFTFVRVLRERQVDSDRQESTSVSKGIRLAVRALVEVCPRPPVGGPDLSLKASWHASRGAGMVTYLAVCDFV